MTSILNDVKIIIIIVKYTMVVHRIEIHIFNIPNSRSYNDSWRHCVRAV